MEVEVSFLKKHINIETRLSKYERNKKLIVVLYTVISNTQA